MFTVALYTYGQMFYIFRCRQTPNQFPTKHPKYHLQTPIVFKGINHIRNSAIWESNHFTELKSILCSHFPHTSEQLTTLAVEGATTKSDQCSWCRVLPSLDWQRAGLFIAEAASGLAATTHRMNSHTGAQAFISVRKPYHLHKLPTPLKNIIFHHVFGKRSSVLELGKIESQFLPKC